MGGGKFHAGNWRLAILEREYRSEGVLCTTKKRKLYKHELNVIWDGVLQMFRISFKDIPSTEKICISHVWLGHCYDMANLHILKDIQLEFNLSMSVLLSTIKRLTINMHNEGKVIKPAELREILLFSSRCGALRELWLYYCLLPLKIEDDSADLVKSRNVTVFWVPLGIVRYKLDLPDCQWELDGYWSGGKMTNEEYQLVQEEFTQRFRHL